MPIDRNRLVTIFDELGWKLSKPATICIIGSSPGIALGQPERQSPDIDVEAVGQYGSLTVTMPAAALLSAAKLVRGSPRDVQDVVWWVKERALQLEDIVAAIESLPDATQRQAASENAILVELVVANERGSE